MEQQERRTNWPHLGQYPAKETSTDQTLGCVEASQRNAAPSEGTITELLCSASVLKRRTEVIDGTGQMGLIMGRAGVQ